ncbi:hypothetical protein [Roseinatronobacter sp. NSM]|uniref:hypothetical protein n=1 Tax=Roseinatronobacter sp. NSM TaxID=3457785 RepID=UPI004036D355
MVLLSVGLNTPSLRLRESNATLHSAKFNIDWDIPAFLFLAVALFLANPFASRAAKYNSETFVSAVAVYTSYRVINRVLSVAADTSVQVGIIGTSAGFKPGHILRSLLDTLDRFADLLFPLIILAGVLSIAISPVASLAAALAALGFALRISADFTARHSTAFAPHIKRLGNACAGIGILFALVIPLTYSAGYLIGNQITARSWEDAVTTFEAFETKVHVADEALQEPTLGALSLPEGSPEQTQADPEIAAQGEAPNESADEELSRWRVLSLMDQSWGAVGEAWGSLSDGVTNVAIGARNVGNNSVQAFSSVPEYLEKSSELVSAAFQYLIALIVKTLVIPMLIVGVGLWLWRIFWKPAHTMTIRPAHEMRDRSPTSIE